MMKLEVEVISTETIKPSSPTPQHLGHYQLSFLDQISPPVYNPLVLFYTADDEINNNNNTETLGNFIKQSLSEVFTCFYPLAGRIHKDNNFIECNDEGIPFKKARVKCQLLHLLQNPNPNELNKLLPFDLAEAKELPIGIQFNIFDCGGIGLGICISHKVGDAQSFFTFVKSWAATARGEKHTVRVEFVSATLFPPKNILGFEPSTGITKENVVTKRFVFAAPKIEEIRSNYTHSESCTPSRVEALSAFIWSRFVAATKPSHKTSDHRFYTITHAVNLRTKMEPPLPDYSFGNLYRTAVTIPCLDNEDEERYNHIIISQMRDSLRKVDKDYVKKLQQGDEHLGFIRDRAEKFARGEIVSFSFTSLCRFPLYEADFGWGKPVWAASASLSFKNLVTFMDTVSGDHGVEAWINLKEEDMAKLEADEKLLSFAS